MTDKILIQLFEKNIKDTPAETNVTDVTIFLCHLTFAVREGCELGSSRVHLNTRMLKHLYDKRPAEEFHFILRHLVKIVRYPDRIYANMNAKRGDLGFVKRIRGNDYFCSIQKGAEQINEIDIDKVNHIVTCFRLRKESYLKNYRLLWSWKGGLPSS